VGAAVLGCARGDPAHQGWRGKSATRWSDGSGKTVQLTSSELASFIEGRALVGKKMLSPAAVTLNDLAVQDRP
jgi:hypothetical protein